MYVVISGGGKVGSYLARNLVKKLLDRVKEGRRTPEEATRYLARFCSCGVFNASRAERIFEKARTGTP